MGQGLGGELPLEKSGDRHQSVCVRVRVCVCVCVCVCCEGADS